MQAAAGAGLRRRYCRNPQTSDSTLGMPVGINGCNHPKPPTN
ncbi:hypothetical protein AM1_5064 [Acaryochloris marina MBIC11017]|uniref:Uncharacterized protein n=1 Tax=Acaryochloris marina (strain MBIC 11017) TaxID=329726 RepID=B0C753_ACAM1|nr:hypothetical protein [Acaryochloris marina]ABW30030.1 hypothetical protein AM1_5064 [Acaryochloris marina MBIC11017]